MRLAVSVVTTLMRHNVADVRELLELGLREWKLDYHSINILRGSWMDASLEPPTPEQFAEIVVKTGPQGQITRLRDVGRVELGAKSQDTANYLDDSPSAGIGVFQLPGSNALDTARRVKSKMAELKQRFPEGLDFRIYYDTTPFISESIHEVFKTLRDAVILVALVVLAFLQNWRSAVIPLVAVPVAIAGFATPLVAAAAMSGSSLVVTLNALRAARQPAAPLAQAAS